MRDFTTVFRYELKQQLGKRAVRVTTLLLIIIALVGTSIPRISALFAGDSTPTAAEQTTALTEQAGYVFADDALQQEYVQLLSLKDNNLYTNRDQLVSALKDKTLKVGFLVDAKGFEAIYQDKGIDDNQVGELSKLMGAHQQEQMLAQKGLTLEELNTIENYQPEQKLTVMGKVTENNILVSMVLMVLVYMLVLIYGNITSVIIAREKDSKTMELLITSTKPTPLILGKVAASGVSGILQFGLVVLAAFAGFKFSQEFYSPTIRMMLLGALSTNYLLTYLFFSVFGYLLYLFLYAALGSTVSRVEDVNSATAVVQFIFVAGYVASSFVMQDPHGTLAVVTSLFPFTGVMVMPMRAGLTTVPAWQILLGGALMLGFVALFALLSIKIYRWGSLNYGNKTNIFKIVRESLRPHKRAKA